MATKTDNNQSNSNNNGPNSFVLHITNLPLDLEKDGVKNIFLEYGEVTSIIITKGKNNTNQAYISFKKYIEAERAITGLNKKLPLMLGVQFKDKNLKNLEQPIEVNLSTPFNDFRYKESFLDNIENSKKFIDIGKANCSPILQSNSYAPQNELLYPVPDDLLTFNPYESPDPYNDTNLMYTRGIAHISKDGRRHISFGRGYTYYNLPEPHYNIAAYLQNVCERREKGIYEYASEDIEDDTGNCKICSTPTAFKCQKCCIVFYCSKPCQVSDWPRHKQECQPIPLLVKKVPVKKSLIQNDHSNADTPENEFLSINQISIHQTSDSQAATTSHQRPTPLRRPKMQPSQQLTSSSESIKENKKQQQQLISTNSVEKKSFIGSMRNQNIHHRMKENQNEVIKQSIGSFKVMATSFPKKQSQIIDPCKIISNNSEDQISFQTNTFIPKDKFITVTITSVLGNDEYWVQKDEDSKEIQKLFENLEKYAETAKRIQPQENIKCILEYENAWYRVTIMSLKNEVAKVFFHDFGTFEDITVINVCSINGFEELPYFARRIRLTDSANSNLKILKPQTLSVKAMSIDADGTIIVQAQPISESIENYVTKELTNCKISKNAPIKQLTETEIACAKIESIPNIFETLKIGESGLIIWLAEISQSEFNITLIPATVVDDFGKLLKELKADCEASLAENPTFRPKVGELVCGQSIENEWFRGVILSTKPIVKLAVIDESRVIVPVKCTPMFEKYNNIYSLGLVCKFLPNTIMPEVKLENGYFTVEEISNDSAIISVSVDSSEFNGKALIKKWIPKPEQKGIQWTKLTSGQEIVIVYFSSQNLIYVRSLDSKEKERTHRLEQDIAKYALNPQPLLEKPVVGQMVLSYYQIDKNFYRAIIIKVEGEKLMIKYIDYGNDEITEMTNLFNLPDELKELPSCVAKIKLKGVDKDVPLTEDAVQYFNELIGESAALKCTFEGHPFKDGVILKTSRNENVNDKLKLLLKPTWEKENPENNKRVYKLNDLPVLKLGNIGDEVQVIVLAYYESNGTIILGPDDIVAAEAIQDQLLENIAKYVKKTSNHYIPRDNELCIAKYENTFYRALCLDSSVSPNESRVFFIDYGNSECVKHTDIRMFTEDFTSFGAFATLCNITPMVPKNKFNDKVSKRISELVPINDLITIKIIGVDVDDSPNIDIPSIRVKLIKEGLL